MKSLGKSNVFRNARIKYFPDSNGNWFPYSVKVFNRQVFKLDGWEARGETKVIKTADDKEKIKGDNSKKSFKASKDRLFDILMCTKCLDCFVTLTLSSEAVDRTDYNAVVKKLSTWLDNRVRRENLTYILVPEFHDDGENIHFHGLMNMEALKLVRAVNNDKDSPFYLKPLCDKKKRPVYNISDYVLGFSSVIKITGKNGREACAKYCWKYITKTEGQKVGGRYYLSGGALVRPVYEYLDAYLESVPAESVRCGENGEYGEYRNYIFDEGFSYEDFLLKQM